MSEATPHLSVLQKTKIPRRVISLDVIDGFAILFP
jgi:hypothetical protein